jgi:hypothetical protein
MGLRSKARTRLIQRVHDDYAAYLDRAPSWDGGSWPKLVAALHSLDPQRKSEALQHLADFHVAGCARMAEAHYRGRPVEPSLDGSLLEALAQRGHVDPVQIERLIDRRPAR